MKNLASHELSKTFIKNSKMDKNNCTDILVRNQSVNNVDDDGNTLLHHALLNNHINCNNLLPMLINGKVDVNAKNKDGLTALHLVTIRAQVSKPGDASASQTSEQMLLLLIAKGALVNAQDNDGNTALHMAVARRTPHLLNNDATRRQVSHIQGQSSRHIFCNITYGAPPEATDSSENYLSSLKTLSKVCDLNIRNSSGKTALHIAADSCLFEAVKTLLVAGANVNIKDDEGNTALHCAVIPKPGIALSILTLATLLDRGADVNIQNIRGETAVHLFIDRCVYDSNSWHHDFKLLLSRGVNVNLQDYKGESCLIRAVRRKLHPIGIEHILNNKVLLNLTDNEGNSALHYAALSMSRPMMRTLIGAGADVNVQNKDGKTPLHLLFELHDRFNNFDIKDIIELSLSHRFNVNLQDRKGDSLLHLATRSYWHDEFLNVLLVKGARIDAENCKGETVADLYVDNLYQTCSDVDMIKLTEAGIKYYMTSGIGMVVWDTLRSEFFKRSCLKELARMKQTKIGCIFSSYGDPVYVADAELEELVVSGDIMDQFPIYGILLRITYEKAKYRDHLLDVISCNFDFSVSSATPFTLLSEIKRLILSYLSDNDLSHLFKAIRPQVQNHTL